MNAFDGLRIDIGWTALVIAAVLVLISALHLGAALWSATRNHPHTIKTLSPHTADAKGVADIVNAFASLTEALVKAGPALWTLLCAALFMVIACVAAGAIGTAPSKDQAPSAQGAAANPGRAKKQPGKPVDENAHISVPKS